MLCRVKFALYLQRKISWLEFIDRQIQVYFDYSGNFVNLPNDHLREKSQWLEGFANYLKSRRPSENPFRELAVREFTSQFTAS